MRLSESSKRMCIAAAAAALGGIPLGSFAGRPLSSEDADVLEAKECELQSYALRQSSAEAARANGFHIDFGCGIGTLAGQPTQLAAGYTRWRSADERAQTIELGGKTGLVAGDDASTGVSLAYGLNIGKDAVERFKHDEASLKAAITAPVAGFRLHGNLGGQRSFTEHRYDLTYALAIEREAIFGLFDLAAELFGTNHHPAWAQMGARWVLIKDKLHIDASFGREIRNSREKALTLGLKLSM